MRIIRLLHDMQVEMGKLFWAGLILVLLTGCGEDVDLFIPRAAMAPQGDVSELQDQLRADLSPGWTSTVQCPCEGGQAFRMHDDLILDIPYGFIDVARYPCEGGYFTIRAEVMDSRGEILAGGIPTVSEGMLLDARIQCNLEVFSGGQPVELAQGKQIRMLVNDGDPRDRMELFYGASTAWRQADGNPDTWDNVNAAEWYLPLGTGGTASGFGYETHTDSLRWVGIEVFHPVPPQLRSSVCVELPDGYSHTNTAVYMVFRDIRSLMRLDGDPEVMQYCEPYGASPAGYRVTFVVIAKFGHEDYRFAAQESTLSLSHTEVIEPRKTPYEEILHYLADL